MACPEALGDVPDRGYLLGNRVGRPGPFPREEVEAALKRYFELAAHETTTGDWNPWADLFTEDATYVEHSMGVLRGRQAIRSWVSSVTGAQPMSTVGAPDWYLIGNDSYVVYTLNQRPAPDGEDPYQFVCISPFCYGGDGLWCYEEDVKNPHEIVRTATLWKTALAATRNTTTPMEVAFHAQLH